MPVRTTAARLATAGWRAAACAGCSLVLTLVASCQPGAAPPHGTGGGRGAVVVASFNFPESELLAAIYGLAIQHAGIPVQFRLGLGPRELVQPALEQGLVDVVPEYLGTALASLEPRPGVPMSDPAAVRAALAGALAGGMSRSRLRPRPRTRTAW